MKINNKFNSNKFSIISPLMLSLLLILFVNFSIGIVEAAPEQRIVSLAPSNTEILFAIGAGDRIVGVTLYCNYPPEAANITKVGGFWPPRPEYIINASPTIIFAKPPHRRLIDGIGKTNITIFIDEKNIEDIYTNIELIGTHTGNLDEARTLVDRMRSRMQNTKSIVEGIPTARRPSVLYATWHDPIFAAGSDTFIVDVIGIAGGINVVKEKGWPAIGIESIISMNPNVIITSTVTARDGILANPALSRIDAVVNRRVIVIRNEDIISRPGPRIVYGIEDMHAIIIQNLILIPPPPLDPGVTPPPVVVSAPNITSFAPSLVVNDFENATRTFNITIDQIVNVRWLINGTKMQTNVSRTDASYTNISASFGIWNISAVVNNPNGTNMQMWIWNVSAALPLAPPVTPLTNIKVSDVTIVVNRTYDFNATPIPAGAPIVQDNVRWTVTNVSVGTINGTTGIFTAHSAGTTTITARYENFIVNAIVTIPAPPITPLTGIKVSDATILFNRTHDFNAAPIPAGAPIVQDNVRWTVANASVGTINGTTGVFTARSSGTTTITARYGNFIVNAIATIPAPPAPPPISAPEIPGFGLVAIIFGIIGAILILLKKKN